MLIERKWAMPSAWTFQIKPIRELLEQEMPGYGTWIDPYAGRYSPAHIKNDLNPDAPTAYHMEAREFLSRFEPSSVDGILFDPPYSTRQVKECYDNISGGIKWDGRCTYWSEAKDLCAKILRPGGKILCFGWNSMGLGKNRNCEMTRILLVPHGGIKNDTICTVEIKKEDKHAV